MGAEPEPLDREDAKPELPLRGVELRPAVGVDALTVAQVELQRVEGAPRQRRGHAVALGGILEREEDARPAVVAPELRHLAFDPKRGQAGEPVGDAAVESGDRVDLALAVEKRLDLHAGSLVRSPMANEL